MELERTARTVLNAEDPPRHPLMDWRRYLGKGRPFLALINGLAAVDIFKRQVAQWESYPKEMCHVARRHGRLSYAPLLHGILRKILIFSGTTNL